MQKMISTFTLKSTNFDPWQFLNEVRKRHCLRIV